MDPIAMSKKLQPRLHIFYSSSSEEEDETHDKLSDNIKEPTRAPSNDSDRLRDQLIDDIPIAVVQKSSSGESKEKKKKSKKIKKSGSSSESDTTRKCSPSSSAKINRDDPFSSGKFRISRSPSPSRSAAATKQPRRPRLPSTGSGLSPGSGSDVEKVSESSKKSDREHSRRGKRGGRRIKERQRYEREREERERNAGRRSRSPVSGRRRSPERDRSYRKRDRSSDRDRDRDSWRNRQGDGRGDRDKGYRRNRFPQSVKAMELEEAEELLDAALDDGMEAKETVTISETHSDLPLDQRPRMSRTQRRMAQVAEKAEKVTGVAVPKYYRPSAVNPLKYAEQVQKRKLLWGGSKEKKVSDSWQQIIASTGDDPGSLKMRKMLGLKEDAPLPGGSAAGPQSGPSSAHGAEPRNQEWYDKMDQQYAVARMSTHTHRGVGLGFASQAASFMTQHK